MAVSEEPNIYLPAEQMYRDAEYKKEALEYVREQRALIKEQSRNTTITLWANILMALATCVIAYYAYTQNNLSTKMVEYDSQKTIPTIQQSQK